VRPTPAQPGSYDVFFNTGSQFNDVSNSNTLTANTSGVGGFGSLRRLGLLRLGSMVPVIMVVMIVAAARAVDMAERRLVLALDRGLQVLARHLALGDIGLLDEEVDDLVFVERRPQLRSGHRILLEELHRLLLLIARIAAGLLHDQPVHFLLADLNAVGLADLRQQQAEADAAFGDGAVVGLQRLLVLALVVLVQAPGLQVGDLLIDDDARSVVRAGVPLELTRTEYALLEAFLAHPRRVLERSWLLNEVWGFDFPTTANSLEVYIGYLRRKTEAESESRLIHTVRGVGYVLRETPP